MNRKIIKQGNNSYTVTLPIKWVRDQNLEDEEVEINEEDNKVIISVPSSAKRKENSIKINLGQYHPRTIKNILNNFYRKGYDKVVIEFENKEQIKEIRKSTKDLLGFEIVDEKEKECVLQNIAEPTGEKYDAILRKIFISIKDDASDLLETWKKGKIGDISRYEESKNIIDTYTNFCRRVVIKEKIGGSKNSYFNMILISRLSLIYHSYYYLAKYLHSKSIGKPKEDILKILSSSIEMFSFLTEAFYKNDIKKLDKIAIIKENTFN